MIGIDEVGRGAWAGPLLVVAARKKDGLAHVAGLRDSKLLTRVQREKLFLEIQQTYDLGDGWVYPKFIDRYGLTKALEHATFLAVTKLGAGLADEICIDGVQNFLKNYMFVSVRTQVKADNCVPEVSAAAIAAKVLRDYHMYDVAKKLPGYGFEKHVGYGTAYHRRKLEEQGVSDIHRRTYKPVAELL